MASNNTDRLMKRARAYVASGDAAAARHNLELLIRLDAAHTEAHLLLAAVAYAEDRYRDCAQHTIDAATRAPKNAEVISRIVLTLLQVGEVVAARRCLDSSSVADCRSGVVLQSLAASLQMIGDHWNSLRLLDRAHELGCDAPGFRFMRAVQLMFVGEMRRAEMDLDECLRQGATYGRASVTLARLRKQTPEDNHVAFIRAQLERPSLQLEDRAAYEFALYKELEDIDDFENAWSALDRGNELMASSLNFDSGDDSRIVQRTAEICDPLFLSMASKQSPGPLPIFIVGMPRSGTTVLDRMLGCHSQITSAGELGDFARAMRWGADHQTVQALDDTILDRIPQLDFGAIGQRYLSQTQWRADGKRFFVDKLPANWIQAGFIRRALPGARLLHIAREPMDVCFSNFRAFFGVGYAYSYSLESLAAHYKHYCSLMAHWRAGMPDAILDIRYEDLVIDPEKEIRRILRFCDLQFEDTCLDIRNNKEPVATLSSVQARNALQKKPMSIWHRYERQLAPLQALLDAQ